MWALQSRALGEEDSLLGERYKQRLVQRTAVDAELAVGGLEESRELDEEDEGDEEREPKEYLDFSRLERVRQKGMICCCIHNAD